LRTGKYRQFFDDHAEEISLLTLEFSGYNLRTIDDTAIRNWLTQFRDDHLNVAVKLLHHVDYYDGPRVLGEQKKLHQQLLILNATEKRRILFCPFGQAGKSSGVLLHQFKLANEFSGAQWNKRFVYQTELSKPIYSERDDLLFAFIDDFVGTGDQITGKDKTQDDWSKIDGLIHPNNKVYLCVLSATEDGVKHIQRKTRLQVVTNKILLERDKIFSPRNATFTRNEKQILREYCEKADSEQPFGYGNCQTTVAFYFRTPDNTIAILRANNPPKWKGLFVRNL